MIRPIRGRGAAAPLLSLLALTATLHAQPAAAPEGNQEEPPQRVAIGFRVRALPVRSWSVMDNGRSLSTTTASKTVYDWNYNTSSHSFPMGGGLVIEALLSPRLKLSAELTFNRLRYTKVTDLYWGTDDPTTSNDERSHRVTTEETQARLFDVPVLLHRNVRSRGFLSHLYLAGGATVRFATEVRTTTNITNADATTENNHLAAVTANRTILGATVGAGFRFMDEFKIKVTPEVRFTRWQDMTFALDSTRSPRNQVELSISFTR